jgi:hypothetical protein
VLTWSELEVKLSDWQRDKLSLLLEIQYPHEAKAFRRVMVWALHVWREGLQRRRSSTY